MSLRHLKLLYAHQQTTLTCVFGRSVCTKLTGLSDVNETGMSLYKLGQHLLWFVFLSFPAPLPVGLLYNS